MPTWLRSTLSKLHWMQSLKRHELRSVNDGLLLELPHATSGDASTYPHHRCCTFIKWLWLMMQTLYSTDAVSLLAMLTTCARHSACIKYGKHSLTRTQQPTLQLLPSLTRPTHPNTSALPT